MGELKQLELDVKHAIGERHRQILLMEKQLAEKLSEFQRIVEQQAIALGHDLKEVVFDIATLSFHHKEG